MGLKLCVYDWNDDRENFPPDSALTIKDYLTSPPAWKAYLHNIIILFDDLSMDDNESINGFGMLSNIVPQLEEMAERLSENKFAILRTAGEHQAVFFILEPVGSKVLFSALTNIPMDYLGYFPLKKSPEFFMDGRDQRALLYDFVEKHGNIHPANPQYEFLEYLHDRELDYATLLHGIREQIELGHQLQCH
jgi:hypothetical protein